MNVKYNKNNQIGILAPLIEYVIKGSCNQIIKDFITLVITPNQ